MKPPQADDDQLYQCVVVCLAPLAGGGEAKFVPGDLCRASELAAEPHPGHWRPWPMTALELRRAQQELMPHLSVEAEHAMAVGRRG